MNKGGISSLLILRSDSMRFVDPYTLHVDKINSLQHWILIHSIIYYKFDTNITTDYKYDMNCKQLVRLQDKFRKSNKNSRYYYVFKDFDGSTGFDLIYKLKGEDYAKLVAKAEYLINRFGDVDG